MTITSTYLSFGLFLAMGAAYAGAPSTIWRLNRRSVVAQPLRLEAVAPSWVAATPGRGPSFFLAAQAQSIQASLREAGWQEQTSSSGTDRPYSPNVEQSGCLDGLEPPPDAIFTYPNASGTAQEALVLWRAPEHGGLHDPLPVWQAAILQRNKPTGAANAGGGAFEHVALVCRDLLSDVTNTFLDGEARTLVASAPGHPSVPFVEMRHSAAEMRYMLGVSSQLAALKTPLLCPAELLLPVPKRPALPLPQTVFWHDAMTQRRVAITFDACSTFGHGDYNPAVIAVLQAMHVPATLFIGGHWAEMHPAELQALAANPLFEIGNHTYSHPHMRELTPEAQKQELLWTQDAIFSRTGVLPRFFRPPIRRGGRCAHCFGGRRWSDHR